MPFLFRGFENIWQEGDEAFDTNRLSVFAAYVAFAFVAAIVLGLF